MVQVNEYFDGLVKSLGFQIQDGTRFTIGVIEPGSYEFETHDQESIRCTSGKMTVDGKAIDRHSRMPIVIPPGQKFVIIVEGEPASYVCQYRAV